MAIERIYNVPLRKEFMKAPKYRRAKKAVIALREFLAKHMKTDPDNVKIQQYANLLIWKRGMKSPPHHIKIKAVKQDDGIVIAELVGAPEKKQPENIGKQSFPSARNADISEQLEEKAKAATEGEQAETTELKPTETKFPGHLKTEFSKPKKLGKKALQKEMHVQVEKAATDLREKVHEHQETAKKIEQEEIKELKAAQESIKKHKPRIPKQPKTQETHPTGPAHE